MDLDSVVDNRVQPNPESEATGQCMCILIFISHLDDCLLESPLKWFISIVLIVLMFLGLINHIME
jgi:hypothetical protein